MSTAISIPSGAARLAAVTSGRGAPVVFLHAGVGDRRMWRHQMAVAALSHHAVAYDRRGFGETLHADETYSHVDDLMAVLDAIAGGEPAVLVGASQGGRIAIDATLAHPDRVRALVLIAPAVSGSPAVDYPPSIVPVLAEIDASEDLDRVNALEARVWLDGPTSPEGRVGGPARELFLAMNGIALRAQTAGRLRDPPPAYDRVGEIAVPTLVAWGDLDFPHLLTRSAYLARAIPGAQAGLIEGAAHMPSLENPGATSAIITEFLRRV